MGIEFDSVPEKMFKITACEETGQEFCWIYCHHHDGPFFPNEDEISEVRWFSPEELENLTATRLIYFLTSILSNLENADERLRKRPLVCRLSRSNHYCSDLVWVSIRRRSSVF